MNTVKETLIEKRDSLINEYESMVQAERNAIADRAWQLLDLEPYHNVLKVGVESNRIEIYFENKEILSINAGRPRYSKPYLNTYSTMMEDSFEFQRMVFIGQISKLFLKDNQLFEKLFAAPDKQHILKKDEIYKKLSEIGAELARIEKEEDTKKIEKLKDSIFQNTKFEFEKPQKFYFGNRKFAYYNNVTSVRCTTKKPNRKFVDVEIITKPHDMEYCYTESVRIETLVSFLEKTTEKNN